MKIFETDKGSWEEKVNFVDKNNVLVGYDMGQNCCEDADWFISTKEENEQKEKFVPKYIEEYVFDTGYFVEVDPKKDDYSSVLAEGGMVRFRLVAENKPDLYLHLYNCHNGYYGHNFEAKIGGETWKEGGL